MEDHQRGANPINRGAHEFTEAEVESISKAVEYEIAHTGLPPYPAITLLAQRYLQPDLDRQRRTQEDRHENEIGLAGREVLPALLREQERDREQLEYAQFVQIRDLASRIEEIYWLRAFEDPPEALRHRHVAAERLLDAHRVGEEMLARTHDEDLDWLHAPKNPRIMLTWPTCLSSRTVDAMRGLRELQEREWDVLQLRHEHEIHVKALVLEHEEDRAAALSCGAGRSAGDPQGPEKASRPERTPRPRRGRKPDLDFER